MSVHLFVDSGQLRAGSLVLRGDEHHYLSKVRRLAVGDSLTLFDGQGSRAKATLVAIAANDSELLVETREEMPAAEFTLTFAPALIKGERMDFAITKMVELGVACIRPTITDRTIVRLKAERAKARRQRFQSLALAAARQSQNPHPTQIEPIAAFRDVLQVADAQQLKLIPCLSKEARPLEEALPNTDIARAMVLIGPEGGFTAGEITQALDARFLPVSLGSRTLRAETACLALASILSFRYGDVGRR